MRLVRNRRFGLFAGVLAACTLALGLASPGLALRRAVVKQLFGPKLVRAEAIEKGGADLRLDRGVITQVNSTQLTLREADGRIQTIPLAATTKVTGFGSRLPVGALARRWHVFVVWPAGGTAQSIEVGRTVPGKAVIQQLFGPKLVRAEAIGKHGADWRLDRGVITLVSSTQLTLREADGRIQTIPLSAFTDVIRLGHHLPPSVLAPRWHVLVTWQTNGAAESVDVEHSSLARQKQAVASSAAPVPGLS